MSLQNYDITVAPNKTQEVAAQGRYLYYYDGTTPNVTAGTVPATSKNLQIKVVAGTTGASVLLMPGQSIRLADTEKAPSMWKVTNAIGAETITGTLLVGEGEFHDSNVSNTLKLDATFANSVTVTNGVGAPVPVAVQGNVTIANPSIEIANDVGNRIPVTLDPTQVIQTAQTVMAYTASYSSTAQSVAGTAVQMLAPATNVNGVILNKFENLIQVSGGSTTWVVLAKATAPANLTDGDVLLCGQALASGRVSLDISKDGQPKVAAGKGIWFYSSGVSDQTLLRDALFTVL